MLSFEQGEQLLKEMNTTAAELDNMWNVCAQKGHKLIAQLDRYGKGWRDLSPQAIKTLPREYQKITAQCEKKNTEL